MLIGVLGAGQLGQMLGLAGINLGARFRFFDPATNCPAEAVGECIHANWDDQEALERFCKGLDVCTFEFENVPAATLEFCAARVPTYPNVKSLTTGQDRAKEKEIFKAIGFEVPPYALIDTETDLARALGLEASKPLPPATGVMTIREEEPRTIAVPCVLKARRGGYDGKGQAVIRDRNDALAAWDSMGRCPAILETFIPFKREVSIIATRSASGTMSLYPLTENNHSSGILSLSIAPAPHKRSIEAFAQARARDLLEQLDYRGTLAIEMFELQTAQGSTLIPNEFAPRVHNTGHWTIEGATVSQFENHIRAIMGMPTALPRLRGVCAMVNLIGTVPDLRTLSELPNSYIHLYGKAPRPGRKLGHVTLVAQTDEEISSTLKQLGIVSKS